MWTTRLKPDRRHQRGIGIIAALVVSVILAGLALLLSRLTATQASAVALDERGVRAYWAARAGLDWGSWQIKQNSGACSASTVLPIPAGATSLSDFKVTLTCSGSGPYLLTATACAPVADCSSTSKSAVYVERVATRSIE